MSHKVCNKKHEETGGAERVLKYWTLNGLLLLLDILESLFYEYIFKSHYIYLVYLLCKSAFFVFLFINNFHNASALYDWVIPGAYPVMQPRVEYATKKVSTISDYVTNNITPGFANSLAGQMSSIMVFVGSKLLSMLEFKAAGTEPQRQLSYQPQANRMAMSMISSSGENILGENKTDVNVTHLSSRRIMNAPRPRPRPKFDSSAAAI